MPLPERAADLRVATLPLDISHDLEAALDGPIDLVTASALLDLVSAEWLERLVIETAARRLPVYAALIYEGTIGFEPADVRDGGVIDAVNRHQRSTKGFGPALGPQAAAEAIQRFERAGYAVTQGPSDWLLAPSEGEIQNEVLAGWARAARENGSAALSEILDWLTYRRDLVTAGRSSIRVGHVDFFAAPTATR